MNSIEYNLGILERLAAGSINGKPYVMLDDVKYIIKNGGVINKDNNNDNSLYERRSTTWPNYYDDIDAKDYHEWFIKGTNIKLGFDYINIESNERQYYCIVSESYDDQIPFETEKDMIEHFDYITQNKNFSWRYFG